MPFRETAPARGTLVMLFDVLLERVVVFERVRDIRLFFVPQSRGDLTRSRDELFRRAGQFVERTESAVVVRGCDHNDADNDSDQTREGVARTKSDRSAGRR